jgi:hypothetical protein
MQTTENAEIMTTSGGILVYIKNKLATKNTNPE